MIYPALSRLISESDLHARSEGVSLNGDFSGAVESIPGKVTVPEAAKELF